MSLQDRTGPHRSASSLDVSSRWLALASRAKDTASEGTSLRIEPRFSSASSSLMQRWTTIQACSWLAIVIFWNTSLPTCFLLTYRYFICVCMFKVLLHYGGDSLLKVPLIQRGNHGLIHTISLSTESHILGFTKVNCKLHMSSVCCRFAFWIAWSDHAIKNVSKQYHSQYLSFVIVGVFLIYLLRFINFTRPAPHTFASSPSWRQRSVITSDMLFDNITMGNLVKEKKKKEEKAWASDPSLFQKY